MLDRKFHNIFRSYRFTIKGKKIGCSESWKTFDNFKNDMFSTYEEGKRLCRIDKSKIFCKENCSWVSAVDLAESRPGNQKLTYEGETLSLRKWSEKLELSLSGIKLRFHRCKNIYTTKEILFGKEKNKKRKISCSKSMSEQQIKNKASKMISAYRIKDIKNFKIDFKLDVEWFTNNILNSKCYYCEDSENIGCDRIDNSKPHYKENVLPCCYICNTARNNHFTVEEFKLIGKTIKEIKKNRTNDKTKSEINSKRIHTVSLSIC